MAPKKLSDAGKPWREFTQVATLMAAEDGGAFDYERLARSLAQEMNKAAAGRIPGWAWKFAGGFILGAISFAATGAWYASDFNTRMKVLEGGGTIAAKMDNLQRNFDALSAQVQAEFTYLRQKVDHEDGADKRR